MTCLPLSPGGLKRVWIGLPAARLALLFLLGLHQIPVFPAEATATMEVLLEVGPIKMLHVDADWEVVGERTDETGDTVVALQAQYGVTCNVAGASIYATLVSELPDGVEVSLRMASSIGESSGWIELRDYEQTRLVNGVRGAEFGVAEMTISLPHGVALPAIPITIAYAIE